MTTNERLREALDTIEDAIGSDPTYEDGPRLHSAAAAAVRELRAALAHDRPFGSGLAEALEQMPGIPALHDGKLDYRLWRSDVLAALSGSSDPETPWGADDDGDHSAFTHGDDAP